MSDNHHHHDDEVNTEVLAETDSYAIWRADDGEEVTFNLELGNVTLHRFKEGWDELVQLIRQAAK